MAIELLVALTSACGVGVADFMGRLNGRFVTPLFMTTVISALGFAILATYQWYFSPAQLSDIALWQWQSLIVAGFLNTLGLFLLYLGLQKGPVGIVSPTASIAPAVVAALWMIEGIYPSFYSLIGLIIACISIVLLGVFSSSPQKNAASLPQHTRTAIIIGLAVALCLSIRMFLIQHVTQEIATASALFIVRGSGTITALLGLFLLHRRLPALAGLSRPSPKQWGMLLLQGIPETLGVLAVFWASRGEYRTIAPALFSCSTLLTILLARLILKEYMPFKARLAAGGVILGAILMTAFSA